MEHIYQQLKELEEQHVRAVRGLEKLAKLLIPSQSAKLRPLVPLILRQRPAFAALRAWPRVMPSRRSKRVLSSGTGRASA